MADRLFIEEVKAGKRAAWNKVRKARRQAASAVEAAERLGISRRLYFLWMAEIPGLKEHCDS